MLFSGPDRLARSFLVMAGVTAISLRAFDLVCDPTNSLVGQDATRGQRVESREVAPTDQLFPDPRHEYSRYLLNLMPRTDLPGPAAV